MKRVYWLLMLVPFLLACGLLQGLSRVKQGVEFYTTQLPQTLESQRPTLEAAATQMGHLVATATAVVAPPPGGAQAPSTGSGLVLRGYASDLEDLRSGRERFVSVLVLGDQRLTLFEMEHRFDRDHNAEAWIGKAQGEEFQVILKEGRAWMLQGDQWVMWSGDPQEARPPLRLRLSLGEIPREVLEEVGRERIAGMEVVHYRIRDVEPAPLSPEDFQVPGMPPLAGEPQVQSFEAHMWVTPDGYLVKGSERWELLLPLQNGQQQPATVEVSWETLDINQPVDIPEPEVTAQPAPPPIPLPADAQLMGQTSQPPAWRYQVPSWSLETGVEYFQQALPGRNFQVKEHQVLPGMAVFRVVSPEGRSWEIMLTPAPTGQGVVVNIIGIQGP